MTQLLLFPLLSTASKVQIFSVTQILREIKVVESRDSKSAILTLLGPLKFVSYEFLYLFEI